MNEQTSDVNTDATSSVASEGTAQVSQDVNNGSGSSPAAGVKESVEDVIAKVLDKHKSGNTDESPTSGEGKAAESVVLKENTTESAQKSAKGKEDPKAVKSDDELPFGKHPRFKELVDQKNMFERELTEIKPLAEKAKAVDQFLTQHNITAQDHEAALRLTALVSTNPAEALIALDKITEQIRLNLGQSLPGDLQKRVDEGTLAQSDAKELATARLDKQRAETRVKSTQEQSSQQARQQIVTSLDSWSKSKAGTDPDFKPKTGANDPDGKYELVYAKFTSMWNTKPPQNVQEAVGLAERAYADVNAFTSRYAKPAPLPKRVTSTSSSARQVDERVDTSKPGWARKVANKVMANRA